MKTYVKDMTTGEPAGLLLSFMAPMVVGNIFQQLYNLVDSMIVGQYVGADALAAVGSTGSVTYLFFALCVGMASGTGIVISQNFGAGNEAGVKKAVANGAYIMVAVSILMGVLGAVLSRPALIFLHTPENILDDAVMYMRIMCAGVLAVALYNCVSAILRAVGDSKTPLYFLIGASVLNIVLDLLFVRGFSWGVAGAGTATIIAQLLAGIGSLVFALMKNPFFKIEKEQLKADWEIIWRCVRMGVPLAFQTSLIAISCVALQRVVNTFGSVVVAAFTATSRVEQLVQQPYDTLGVAMSTYTGQNIGAKKIDRVRQGYKRGMLIMAVFTLIMVPIAQLGGESIMRLFVSETEVIALGARALKITSCFYLFLGSIYTTRGLLNGTGDAVFAFLNGLVEMLGRICLAGPLTKVASIGVWGVWLATALTWFLAGSFNIARYFQGKWKRAGSDIIQQQTGYTKEYEKEKAAP
ncbi:MATE family efflux transporter [Lachnospiraceae bacterium 64-25]